MSRLAVLCWEGYGDAAVSHGFAERHDVAVRTESIVSDADTAARVTGQERADWDVVNLNNPFARAVLYPAGAIRPLDPTRFAADPATAPPGTAELLGWTRAADGTVLGIAQRFGPFNLVVDTRRVSRATAEDAGFALAADPRNRGRYGVLAYDDFNILHLCIAAGIDPFRRLDADAFERFSDLAEAWFAGAALVTADHHAMNRALVDGVIDFYLSGGMFTASPARREGHATVRAITPRRPGPIEGRGAIAFLEVTSVVASSATSPLAEAFLAHLLAPETLPAIAFAANTCNPLVQMGDPRVRARFTADQLAVLQWDTLAEDMARCAPYRIPPDHAALLARLRTARRAAGYPD